ncbi:MAG TPA: hypothetical protein VF933_14680, partial [Streptosporangiaceae bacterium]
MESSATALTATGGPATGAPATGGPATGGPATAGPATALEAPAGRLEARLLVVEDEPTILELLSGSLRFAGFDVLTAASGREA